MTDTAMPTPESASGALARAVELHEAGDLPAAIGLYEHILSMDPQLREARHLLGVAALQQGDTGRAIDCFQQVLAVEPTAWTTAVNLGNALAQEGRLPDALAQYDLALRHRPDLAGALFNRGNALMALGRYAEALTSYEQMLALVPDGIEALNNRGIALLRLGNPGAAAQAFERLLRVAPDWAAAWINHAVALLELQRPGDALVSCARALELDPDDAEAHCQHGNALLDLGRPTEALLAFERALRLWPEHGDALLNRAVVLNRLNRAAEALASCDRALQLQPDDPEALNARGDSLLRLERPQEALECFTRALRLREDFPDALNNQACALQDLGRHADAATAWAALLAVVPDYAYAAGRKLHAQLHACDWTGYRQSTDALRRAIAAGQRAELPFAALAWSDSPALQLACARAYVADRHPPAAAPAWNGRRHRHDRIRVAYLSADFRDHPVAHLMAPLLERHDRSRFEIIGVSLRADAAGSDIGRRLRGALELHLDVSDKSDREAGELLADLQVDIAVDLGGHTASSRPGVLACRPAPVQASYLGFAGTTGAPYVDYLIADGVVVPAADEPHYSERIVRLPHTFFPAGYDGSRALKPPTRAEVGLPESGFVFCAFNNTFKFSPSMFDLWMDLLNQVPDSVLWLREFNAVATANLRREAAGRGIGEHRLVFAPAVANREQHLARQQLADLFLDTSPYNAHTTACDALWAGLPVLTCLGTTFAGRVAASLLHAAGLPEMIARDPVEYRSLALRLCLQPALLQAMRDRLVRQRATLPLFDLARHCADLERAYRTMWQRHLNGDAPASLAIHSA